MSQNTIHDAPDRMADAQVGDLLIIDLWFGETPGLGVRGRLIAEVYDRIGVDAVGVECEVRCDLHHRNGEPNGREFVYRIGDEGEFVGLNYYPPQRRVTPLFEGGRDGERYPVDATSATVEKIA